MLRAFDYCSWSVCGGFRRRMYLVELSMASQILVWGFTLFSLKSLKIISSIFPKLLVYLYLGACRFALERMKTQHEP